MKHLGSLRDVGHRIETYVRLMRWLWSLALATAGRRVAFAICGSIICIVLQVAALGLMLKIIAAVHADYMLAIPFADYGIDLRQSLAATGIVAMTGLFLFLSIYARYASRISMLAVDKSIARKLPDRILEEIADIDDKNQRRFFFRNIDEDELVRSLAIGARYCGISTRLLLANSINLIYLVVGIVLLCVFSIEMFFVSVAAVMFGIALAYPLNLRAVTLGRELETASAPRGRAMRDRLSASLENQPLSDEQRQLAIFQEQSFLDVISERLKIIEKSHLVYGVLFSVIIALFAFGVVSGNAEEYATANSLIILFFAARYSFEGLKGLMVAVTSINRYISGVLRVHDVLDLLERSRRRPAAAKPESGAAPTPTCTPAPVPTSLTWRIGSPHSPMQKGRLVPGRTGLVLTRKRPPIALSAQLAAIVNVHSATIEAWLETGRLPHSMKSEVDADARAHWVASVMRDCEIEVSDLECRETLDGLRADDHLWPAVIHYLGRIYDRIQDEFPLLILEKRLLLHLSPKRQRTIYGHLSGFIVLFVLPWLDPPHDRFTVDWLFVSSGWDIAFAERMARMTPEQWDTAWKIYDSAGRGPALDGGSDAYAAYGEIG